MTLAPEEWLQLVRRLRDRTAEGRVGWRRAPETAVGQASAAGRDGFRTAARADFVAQVGPTRYAIRSDVGNGLPPFQLNVQRPGPTPGARLDESLTSDTLATHTGPAIQEAYELLGELYREVSRGATAESAALDDLLRDLDAL